MKRTHILIVAVSVFSLVCKLALAADDPKSQKSRVANLSSFYQANQAYKDGNYPKANDAYENILKTGWESGPLYYNLGNSYFKSGQLGAAILNYERAKRLIPRDSDLESNYRYANSLTKQYEGDLSRTVWEKLYSQYCEAWTLDEITVILLCLFFSMGAIYLGGLYWRWPLNVLISLMCFLGLIFVVHVLVFVEKNKSDHTMAIIMQDGPAKFEPRENATTHFESAEGWKVEVLQEEEGWKKIKRGDGKIGWVKNAQLMPISPLR